MSGLSAGQIGGLGLGSSFGGSLMSAGGAIASGFANERMYDYQAGIAKLNQQIDKQNAEFAVQTGEQQAFQAGLKQRAQMGQIKVAQASSGFDVRSGSAEQVRTSQAKLNLQDTDIIRSNAAKTAYNYELQGTVAGAQAGLYQMAGQNALEAGGISAAGSILGGVSSVSSEWLQGARVGLWGSTGTNGTLGD